MNDREIGEGLMNDREIGERLRLARQSARVSQEDMAQVLRCPRSAISKIETGDRKLSAWELIADCNHFKMGIDEFLGKVKPAQIMVFTEQRWVGQ